MAKNNCFIYETLNDVKTMKVEKTNDGFMHLSGVFGVCGVRNNNHRVYEQKNYASMVTEMQKRIKDEGGIPGELEHPQTMNITLENISHKINSISIDENGVVTGEITLLNTPKGQIAQAIVEGGLPLYISSRAQGNVDKNGNVKLESLKTYDLVGSPGFSQAKLHLNENQKAESLCESIYYITDKDEPAPTQQTKNIRENKEYMMDKEAIARLQESIDEMQNRIEYLEAQNNMLSEELENRQNPTLDESVISQLADGIQDWIIKEYSPEVQKWIVEEYSSKLQQWVVEEFAQEIQNWIVEEYSPEVQKWTVEEFAQEIQNWIVEQYSPTVQNWMVEHFTPEIKEQLMESMQNDIKESRSSKLESIDSIIKLLESNVDNKKPVYGRQIIRENRDNEPMFIAQMPAEKRVQWNMVDESVKDMVNRKAKIYDFSQPGAIERFWESVDLDKIKAPKTINEGLNDIQDDWEKRVRNSFRSRRHF